MPTGKRKRREAPVQQPHQPSHLKSVLAAADSRSADSSRTTTGGATNSPRIPESLPRLAALATRPNTRQDRRQSSSPPSLPVSNVFCVFFCTPLTQTKLPSAAGFGVPPKKLDPEQNYYNRIIPEAPFPSPHDPQPAKNKKVERTVVATFPRSVDRSTRSRGPATRDPA